MQDLFQLNFISYFAACKFALPHLRKTKGNIINMSSLTGYFGQAQVSAGEHMGPRADTGTPSHPCFPSSLPRHLLSLVFFFPRFFQAF